MSTKREFPKSITRMDYKKAVGWYVRIKFKGVEHRKFFSDGAWGGYDDALESAIEWRDEKELEIGKPRTERRIQSNPNNALGVTGIQRIWRKTGATYPDGSLKPNYTEVYYVTWCPNTRERKATTISIQKYGEKEAWRKAVALRRRKEIELYGGVIAS
ncbi:MAG: hypothetical protein ISR60_08780 [Anaerolineales bacterium]|nr:hypothetical protein [Anaerolineales bacterium]